MAKQLLIYESAVPVSPERHGTTCLEPRDTYDFSARINAVPLMAGEFAAAAAEYAIVFMESGSGAMPLAVLGVRPEQNLYLSADSHWQAKYIPAFIRRYPFVFTTGREKDTLALCIDETHPGVNTEGRGQRLFDDDGKPSDYTNQVLKFLQEYQTQFTVTQRFGKRLKDLNLLEPMHAQVTTPAGERLGLQGFHGVTRNRVRTLSGEALAGLARDDALELLYLHLYSLGNFNEVMSRVIGNDKAAGTDKPTNGAATESATVQ
ncbi:MAG: SapC family protein [Gammaproteobacteria bacterium]